MSAKKVLIVDDSKDVCKLLATAVATLDATLKIKTFSTAEEALLELFQLGADLLVIDINLPGLSGLDLARRARTRDQGVGIIAISGSSDSSMREQSLVAGANAFFPKPVPMQEFLQKIADLLGAHPLAEENMVEPTPAAVAVKPAAKPTSSHPTIPPPPVVQKPASPSVAVTEPGVLPAASQPMRIVDVLIVLRKSLGAGLVVVINDRGQVLGQSGTWPDAATEKSLVPTLLPAIGSALRVSQQLGMVKPELVLTFRGSAFNVLVSPVGAAYAVLVLVKKEPSMLRTAIAVEEILSMQKDLEVALTLRSAPAAVTETEATSAAPPAVPAVLPAAPARDEKSDGQLAALLNDFEAKRLKPAEIEAFWEEASRVEPEEGPANPDVLSFDQATRLGLAPKDTGR